MSNNDVYDKIADLFISMLQKGTVPWRKPWNGRKGIPSRATSWASKKAYRGINQILLEAIQYANGYVSPYWMTFNQAKALGGKVKKGEKATPVVFWKFLNVQDKATGKDKKVPLLRYFSVFNADQVAGLPEAIYAIPTQDEEEGTESTQNPGFLRAAEICEGYQNGPEVLHRGYSASYSPSQDRIVLPLKGDFHSEEEYFNTRFHEMVHSTGHKSRLNRPSVTEGHMFGDETYSREELIAELGAAFLCSEAQIGNDSLLNNSAAYIASWIKVLRDDPKAVIWASTRAQRAVGHILGEVTDSAEEQASDED